MSKNTKRLIGKNSFEGKRRNWVIGYTIGLLCLWSLFIALANQWEIKENQIRTVRFARYQALSTFQTTSLYYRWPAEQNAAVNDGNRPAFSKHERHGYGHLIHVISLDPADSENAGDEWETRAIQSLKLGADEVSSLETLHGHPYLRFIKICAAKTEDFQEQATHERAQGSTMAAISIAVAMEPLLEISHYKNHNLVMSYTAAWCIGSLIIMLGHAYLKRYRKKHLQYEEQLVEEVEQAEHETVRKTEFLANMSHEIRTPMNSIIGFTELLIDDTLTDEQKDYLETVQNSGKGLLELINDILDISKIESGQLKIVKAQCPIQSIIEDVRSMMKPNIEAKGLTFKLQKVMGTPDDIYTDALRLKQCLINLINNALKFTDTGSINLHISPYFEKKQQWFRFDIQDTGIGIPADKQQDIFREFVQAEDSTAHKYGGTGLGLCITQQLTEMLGGKITLQSQVGQGTTFSIHLPVEEPAVEQDAQPQQSGKSA